MIVSQPVPESFAVDDRALGPVGEHASYGPPPMPARAAARTAVLARALNPELARWPAS
ncbi:hypothetical protein SNE510_29770 [Streptomyces sp. NE5-10]|uniref:hypothetical protein n=1 Tax=Streptomyces sp. NE5-10 TaxID=2759674 RepID=UPI0019070F9A|nr:hypothetical protein [Streptomyces sp. NE5-10]GHJ93458.1 hypothetical protein SNE510_29770 [Streptomyces sp. NE5-10]